MAFVRKRKRRHKLGRTSSGRFVARSHGAPRRVRRKRSRSRKHHTSMVRYNRNPSLIVANPFRGVRRKRRRHRLHVAPIHHRRRRGRMVRRNPFRSRSRGRSWHMGGMGYLVRMGLFGAAGVVAARAAGYLYQQYLAKYVLGNESPGASSMRGYLNDVARIFVMSAATVGISEVLKKSLRPDDAKAFLIGGLAESGRELVGIGLGRAGVTTSTRAKFGLDGGKPLAYVTAEGQVMMLASNGVYYPREQLSGLIDADQFGGLRRASSY